MSMLFDRYASEEFDSNYDDCLEDIKKQLAVRKRGTNKVLYYIYGEYVAGAVAEQYCMSLEKIRRLPRDYFKWLVDNKKKYTIIDDHYFCYGWDDVKKMKKEIINKPNKVFINGGNNMHLVTKAEMVCNQAKLIIRDYEKHGDLDQDTKEDAIYCQGSVDVLIDVIGNGYDIGVTVDELEDLWEKLQEILF